MPGSHGCREHNNTLVMTNTAERIEEASLTPFQVVMQRLSDSTGFPALSSTIHEINRIVASDSEGARQLTQAILRDASLTAKLLQVVNSALYGQYLGRIRTVSKAVLLLGFEEVRSIAMGLMILEFSRGSPQQKALQDELVGAFMIGVMTRPLCERIGVPNQEEAVICAMFQSLGRLLVTFFLYEESQRIRSVMTSGHSEERAAWEVLGLTYQELGAGIAKHWNFPDTLVQGMKRLIGSVVMRPVSDLERLKLAANMANELYTTAMHTPAKDREAVLRSLSRRYAAAVKIDVTELVAVIEQGLHEMAERAPMLNLPLKNSKALGTLRSFTGQVEDTPDTAEENAVSDESTMTQVLTAGISEVLETLGSDFALNDVLQMVLETLYRGMGFTHTMIFIRDQKQGTMRARFGFGDHIEAIIPQCHFSLAYMPDVFHVVVQKGVDIVIDDAHAANIVDRIPAWHRQALDVQSFLLLPVMLNGNAIGLIYADSEKVGGVKVSAKQLDLLRTLRNQVVEAFKRCTKQ